jgi:acyl-homoserine-lactone acylase
MTTTFTHCLRLLALSTLLACAGLAAAAPPAAHARDAAEQARWERQARAVTITRDDWGLAHVHGATNADAVFGMVYAQAEDDYNRIERNYLFALGRTAEAAGAGEDALWLDLRSRMFLPHDMLRQAYADSPGWLRTLMDAWADGLNYYLATHPDVEPLAIARYEPWMALAFTEGSIGGDIERVPLRPLAELYGAGPGVALALGRIDAEPRAPTGSNGIAIAPARTVDGNALLLINPHTSFFFRSELQMTSDEGLDAYGAVTWGQFFVYQGFNHHVGWMHTSTGADNIDEFVLGAAEPLQVRTITVRYRQPDGSLAERSIDTQWSRRFGPVTRRGDDGLVATSLMVRPVAALEQSWLRTTAHDLASYLEVAGRQANSSNNTLFASDKGEIAYLHPQFMPVRDDRFDYGKPVPASDATAWHGLHPLSELPSVLDPPNGWVMNTNNWPYSAAGAFSAHREDYPRYMDTYGENPRGENVLRLLTDTGDFTLESLIDLAFDPYMAAFAELVPKLAADYDALPDNAPLKAKLRGPMTLLEGWDYRWGIASMPTSLAVFWADTLWSDLSDEARARDVPLLDYMASDGRGSEGVPAQRLAALSTAVDRLVADFGSWGVPWGEINRFQRLTGDLVQPFDDARPSIPVPFASSRWGSLASFGAHRWPGTKRYYGTNGNSFVAVVEFGDRVRARAITAGGASGHPDSPHFNDEAERYSTGNLREVYFWPDQLEGHVERVYHPGG